MTTAVNLAIRVRPRVTPGPALRGAPLPFASLVLSSLIHALALAVLVAMAVMWRSQPPRAYVVNLVPSVPAVGAPQGKTAATPAKVAPAPRAEEPAPRPATPPRAEQEPVVKARPIDLPAREAPTPPARPTIPPPPARSTAPPELPTRMARAVEMPLRERPRATPAPPERTPPARELSLPRPGQKDLPSVIRPAPPRLAGTPPAPVGAPPARDTTIPPAPLGRAAGLAHGVGAVASPGGDFPFTWYLKQVERKVYEKWTQPLRGTEGQKAVVVFEIARDGQVSRARVEKSSGDIAYDQAALRAVTDANPLPRLPDDFKESPLRIHFGFEYSGRG
jgi:TonB family protein